MKIGVMLPQVTKLPEAGEEARNGPYPRDFTGIMAPLTP